MTSCWDYNPDSRPTFTELCQDLGDWMHADTCCIDMNQLDEQQSYYNESSGSSYEEHAYENLP